MQEAASDRVEAGVSAGLFRLVVVVFRGADLLWAAPLGLGGAMSVEWPVMATPGFGFLLYWADGLLSLLSACL